MEAKTLVLREIKWFRLNLYPILEMVKWKVYCTVLESIFSPAVKN